MQYLLIANRIGFFGWLFFLPLLWQEPYNHMISISPHIFPKNWSEVDIHTTDSYKNWKGEYTISIAGQYTYA